VEDEVYAAEVERQILNQMDSERDREQRQTFTQTQLEPHALPNPNGKAEVKGHGCLFNIDRKLSPHIFYYTIIDIMDHHNGQLDDKEQ
jgi:hypothetical protein